MKKILGTGVALALMAGTAAAADLPVYKAPVKAALWDIAIGGSIASDYNFRGISQSDRGFSPAAYFEAQYNWAFGQTYFGLGALGVDFAGTFGFTDPAAEVDIYGGFRKEMGAFAFDVGYIYYWYPKETLNTDWAEVYLKVAYTVTPNLTIGGAVYYTPDLLNFSVFNAGNDVSAVYWEANAKWVTPWTSNGIGSFISGAIGYNDIDRAVFHTVDPSYVYYNVGIAFTYKALTLDLRYHGTDMNANECFNALGAPASGVGGRPAQKYCDDTFIAKLSFDTLLSKVK